DVFRKVGRGGARSRHGLVGPPARRAAARLLAAPKRQSREGGRVHVADRHGKRVGRVVRRRYRGAPEQALDHVLPLRSLDAAVTGALGAGVDAEDPHASEASISFSEMSKFDETFCTSSWSSSASISLTICWAGLPSSFT